jgi:glycosyltransferase involved in cell wall biosynthesis
MKVLHVFPLFGHELTDGSGYYEYMLTRQLAALGNEVDVFATRARLLRPTSAFSLRWIDDYPPGLEQRDNIRIYRFSATLSVPAALGQCLSWPILRRWRREEKLFGQVVEGSRNVVTSYHRRALTRPAPYDWLAMLGRGPWSAPLLYRLTRDIEHYDLVLVGFVPFTLVWQVTTIAHRRRVPVAVLALFHPEDSYHHFRSIYRSLSRADLILAQTPYSEKLVGELAPGSKPAFVGAGVEESMFSDDSISGSRFRQKHGLADKFIVLSVGRKEAAKGYRRLVDAIDLINNPEVVLVLIGADVDRAPISSPHVLYLGQVPRAELLDAYAACDVFAMLSEYESFGIVFLEAWMMRKPVIGNSHCKPVSTVINHAVNGFLCESPQAVADTIVKLASDRQLARALGEAGYDLVKRRYTWPHVGERVHQLYTETVERSRRNRESSEANQRVAK